MPKIAETEIKQLEPLKPKTTTKHFVLTDEGMDDGTSPIIGIILGIASDTEGVKSFKRRFSDAVGDYFDVKDFNCDEIPDLFDDSPDYNVMLEIDGMNHELKILPTRIY